MTIKLTPEGDLVRREHFPLPHQSTQTYADTRLATAAELKAAGLQRVGEDEVVVPRELSKPMINAMCTLIMTGDGKYYGDLAREIWDALLNAKEAHDEG